MEKDEGCCLHCPDAEPGCLCYNCKCTSCSAYNATENIKCGWARYFREENAKKEAEYINSIYEDHVCAHCKKTVSVKKTEEYGFCPRCNCEVTWFGEEEVD